MNDMLIIKQIMINNNKFFQQKILFKELVIYIKLLIY